MTTATDARSAMDRMYRWTRHVYDATRKYYLLGRDALIGDLNIKAGETVCEAGCGTARNLILMANRYPLGKFYGFDASAEMLKTASASVEKASLKKIITLDVALAQEFTAAQFGLKAPFDRIVFSYSLSIMDDWQAAVDHALTQLKPGGRLHVVDFGDQKAMPRWFKWVLGKWLHQFHVRFRPEVKAHFEALEQSGQGTLAYREVYRGYAYLLAFTKA
ncbi:MAG: class I SAM-dependent methyltransferase [Alphaproteobacteria bacterium]|nr:class I SAM-dependent methyltransferase [Alphaproteobacteria bacterium]